MTADPRVGEGLQRPRQHIHAWWDRALDTSNQKQQPPAGLLTGFSRDAIS